MKRYLLFGLLLSGCVAGFSPGTHPDYCDPHTADWGDPECTVVEAQGAYSPDYRYVCPQADGTEWEFLVTHTQDGQDVKYYQRYTVVPGHTPHIRDSILCTEGN